jgi:RNA methyltransferase, TrmH family
MITSIRNPKIQRVRKLQAQPRFRRAESAFVVEGVRLLEEALNSNWETSQVLYTQDLDARGQKLLENYAAKGVPVEEVTPEVMQAASDTQSPQGILAVISLREAELFPTAVDFLLIADGVRDPGNLGTILRTAAAAGVGAVLLPPGTTDAYAPKVVRAGMGAHFNLPVYSLSWDEIRMTLSRMNPGKPFNIYLADAAAGITYTDVDLKSPLALIIGGEAQGAGTQAAALAQIRLHIPMPGRAESLNSAVAAAVLMFEVARQRRSAGLNPHAPVAKVSGATR